MIPRAAGTLLVAETTGRALLLFRSDGEGWATPGGMAEPGETPAETSQRELDEETGLPAILTTCIVGYELARLDDGEVMVVDPEMPPDEAVLIYTMFVCTVREEFEPILNDEHRGWAWIKPDDSGLASALVHPGAACALQQLLKDYG